MHAIYSDTRNTYESKHREVGPVRQNPIQRTVRSVHACVHCTVHNCCAQYCTEHHHHTTIVLRPLFPGAPWWASARRELLDFMVQWR